MRPVMWALLPAITPTTPASAEKQARVEQPATRFSVQADAAPSQPFLMENRRSWQRFRQFSYEHCDQCRRCSQPYKKTGAPHMLMRSTILLVASSALLLAACGSENSGAATTDGGITPMGIELSGEPLRAGLYLVTENGDAEAEDERCFSEADIAAGRFGMPNMV